MTNINVLRVAYNQYFCNMPVISDEDLLNIHYVVNEKLSKDEDIESWSDLHEDLLIWQPFEETFPWRIMENIDSLIKDIEMNILPDPNTYLIVNKLELSSEIADYLTKEEFKRREEKCEKYEENGDTVYTETAQDYFNTEFDIIMTIIERL